MLYNVLFSTAIVVLTVETSRAIAQSAFNSIFTLSLLQRPATPPFVHENKPMCRHGVVYENYCGPQRSTEEAVL